MRRYEPLNRATMTPGSAYDTEHNNLAFDAMLWQYSATVAGTPANVAEDGAFRMLGTPEVSQAEEPLIRIEGRTLRHLAAFTAGGYAKTLAPAAAGGALAEAMLDFGKILPGAYVSGEVKAFVRGNVGGLADYSGTAPTSMAGNLRNAVATIDRPPGLSHPRPFYREFSIPIPANVSDQQHLITIDQDMVSAGLFCLVRDADGGGSSPGGARTDGLVRGVKVEITRGRDGQKTQLNLTMGQLRSLTARLAGFTDLDWDQATGTFFIPFVDDSDPRFGGRMALQQGDTVLLTVDSNSTIEEHLGSAVTAASGDEIRVVRLDHQIIGGSVSVPDRAAPVSARQALAVAPAATVSRGGRRRRRGRTR